MRTRLTVIPALLILALGGPVAGTAEDAVPAFLDSLDRSPLVIVSGDSRHSFEVWLTRDREQRARGLMFVASLEANQGMLFIYPSPRPVTMWMKNTLIPLDMLFIEADGRVLNIAENTVPESLEPVRSDGPVLAVLELPGGSSERLGIEPGDYVRNAYLSRLRRPVD